MLFRLLAILTFATGTFLSGCGDATSPSPDSNGSQAASDPHDDHDHDHEGHAHAPESLAEAATEIAELRDRIQAAWEAGDLKQADGPVHELGHLLESLEGLAAKANLTEQQSAELKAATEKLFQSFAQLDETIHGKSVGKSWKDVAEDVNQAVSKLQAISGTNDQTEEPQQ